jgi:hypothetical protein
MRDSELRIIGTAKSPTEIAKLMAVRRNELGITGRQLDQIAGLADGHTSKIECGTKNLGHISLPILLDALGLKLTIVADDATLPSQTRRALGSKRVAQHKLA